MGDMKYEACIDLFERQGNMNLPVLPKCELQATLFDRYTKTRIPVRFNATNVIKVKGVTCGSLQIFDSVNLIIWSSFDIGRFTLYIERVRKTDERTEALQSDELCK
ncbi:hypothetical protein HOU09_gp254 [Dickeya phage vB_DsoM_AD1]|uniref:Uncharacterized protein n=1 Tax=Dickeya phage vB_DsoM_AD1 TaxID=2283029 RepID=A0A384ZYG6_9CAUD|nr:hypothetical protein HOU09_gp254 [Dickeya phage vB_DsoM_AD1]AXG67298.1 hypothetical protein AD1_254 [Dickeya phage vB_DsoM_AD1]